MKPLPMHGLSIIYALLLAGMMLALSLSALPGAAWAEEATSGTEETADLAEPPITLNPIIQVADDYIRLADLFDRVEKYGDRVVARAPKPGEELVLPAVWIWKAAKTFGVDWRPASTADTVTVTRPSSTITSAMLEDLLRDAYFRRTGEDDLVELETEGGPYRINLPITAAPTARVDRFDFDIRSGRFTATMIAPADGRPLQRMNISGRFHRMVELPVPAQRFGAGHILSADDIIMVRMREEGLATNLLVDPERLIGQAVHRSVSAGKPIRVGDVRAPRLVEKGRIVVVSLNTGTMTLTVQGRAMENGAMGDVIRVQNTKSNMIIDAEVTGDGRLEVVLPHTLAMQTQ